MLVLVVVWPPLLSRPLAADLARCCASLSLSLSLSHVLHSPALLSVSRSHACSHSPRVLAERTPPAAPNHSDRPVLDSTTAGVRLVEVAFHSTTLCTRAFTALLRPTTDHRPPTVCLSVTLTDCLPACLPACLRRCWNCHRPLSPRASQQSPPRTSTQSPSSQSGTAPHPRSRPQRPQRPQRP